MIKRWFLVGIGTLLTLVLCAFTLPNFQLTVTPPAGPVLSINGSTVANRSITGTTMTVAASNGPGLARDFLEICISGGACDGGTYASDYLNCTQNQPSTPYPTGTPVGGCTFAVPTAPSTNYFLEWQSLTTGAVIATLPFTVPSGPVSISSLAVSPNSTTVNQAFAGTLAAACSATCPGNANFSFTTDVNVCKTNDNAGADNNNLFTLSGSTLSATAGNMSTAGTYYACIAVAMTGVQTSPVDFEVAVIVSPSSSAQIIGVSVTPNSCSIVPPATTCTFSGTLAAICNVTPCPSTNPTFALSSGTTACSGSNPCVTANGATSGSVINSGAPFTAAVTNGPGNAADRVQICVAGSTPSDPNCRAAASTGYSWSYINDCGSLPGSTGVTAGSCQLRAPLGAGTYSLYLLLNNTFTIGASATFSVVAAPIPAVVQTGSNQFLTSTSPCVFTISQAIGSGHAVLGFIHSSTGTAEAYPTSVTDNVGNNYTLSAGTHWQPYGEDIGYWYNANVTGNPTAFNFIYNNGVSNICDVGFAEYTGVNTITPIVGPTDNASTVNPSITISPSASSWIWAFGATNADEGSELNNSNYNTLISNFYGDGLGVWSSNAMVSSPQTLTWTNSYFNASTCADGTPTTTGCSVVMIAAALSNSGGGTTPTITVNGASSGATVTASSSMTLAVTNGPGDLYDWIDICTGSGTSACSNSDPYVFIADCSPTIPTSGATSSKSCSMTAPSTAGSYTAAFRSCTQANATNCSVTINPVIASATFTVTTGSGGPAITVNGSSTGTTVAAGTSLNVAVTNGPGNATDWIGICNTGAATPANCDGAGYNWIYVEDCSQTVPTSGLTAHSCSNLVAPSPPTTTNYVVNFFSNNAYTVLASAPLTVTAPTGGGTGCSDPDQSSSIIAGLGLTCNTTVSDDFDGTAVDTTKWAYWNCTNSCATAPTAGAPSSLITVQNGYLRETELPDHSVHFLESVNAENLRRPLFVEYRVRYMSADGSCIFCNGNAGYRLQEWSYGGQDWWDYSYGTSHAVNVPEIDFNETFANNLRAGAGLWNWNGTADGFAPATINPTGAQTLGDNVNWHVIQMLLNPSGGGNGTTTWWVDGVQQGAVTNTGPEVLNGLLSNLASGYYYILSGYCNPDQGACAQNSYHDIDYFHVYE